MPTERFPQALLANRTSTSIGWPYHVISYAKGFDWLLESSHDPLTIQVHLSTKIVGQICTRLNKNKLYLKKKITRMNYETH